VPLASHHEDNTRGGTYRPSPTRGRGGGEEREERLRTSRYVLATRGKTWWRSTRASLEKKKGKASAGICMGEYGVVRSRSTEEKRKRERRRFRQLRS